MPLIWKTRNNKKRIFAILILIMIIIPVFLMLPQSSLVWQKITILQKFQFPWRFLAVIVFSTAIAGGVVVSAIKSKKVQLYVVIVLSTFLLVVEKDYWHALSYKQYSDSFFERVYHGTTDTGESAPIWSVRFMEHEPKAHAEIIEGKGVLRNIDRKTTVHDYEINAKTQTRIRENTLYFPGWKVYVDGKSVPIEFQDQLNRGLTTYFVSAGKHYVRVIFTDTKLRLISNIITLFSVLLALLMFIVGFRLKKI